MKKKQNFYLNFASKGHIKYSQKLKLRWNFYIRYKNQINQN